MGKTRKNKGKTSLRIVRLIRKLVGYGEKAILKIASKEIGRLLSGITGAAGNIRLEIVRLRDEDRYGQALYDMGVTLYDKHGFYETGLLNSMVRRDGLVSGVFVGTESDGTDCLALKDLESWSLYSLLALLKNISNDVNAGTLDITRKDGDVFVVDLKDKED